MNDAWLLLQTLHNISVCTKIQMDPETLTLHLLDLWIGRFLICRFQASQERSSQI